MDRGVSPEERLLKLIRGRGRKETDKKTSQAVLNKKKTYIYLEYLKPINKFLKTKLLPLLNFKALNILLILLLVVFAAYFIFAALIPVKGRIQKISESVKTKEEITGLDIKQPEDYEHYYQLFSKRDIFNAPLLETKTDDSGLSPNIKEAVKNFKLVGIILDKKPQAIIEDATSKTTYFLNKGDTLNKLEVKEILESKVILIYAGEEFELEL